MKRYLIPLFALLLPAALRAQETVSDGFSYGGRATLEVDVKLAKGLHLTAHEETRVYGGAEDIFRSYTGLGLEYKFNKFLRAGAEYERIYRLRSEVDDEDPGSISTSWSSRNRVNAFLTGTLHAGDWQFALKETFRLTNRTDDFNTFQGPRNALTLKSKLTVKYRGMGKVVPYASFEMRNALNDATYSATYNPYASSKTDRYLNEEFLGYRHAYVDRLRAQIGLDVKFSKHHELIFYLMGDHYWTKDIDTNREGSESWAENGLVLKSITWHTGNRLWGGIGYTFSF